MQRFSTTAQSLSSNAAGLLTMSDAQTPHSPDLIIALMAFAVSHFSLLTALRTTFLSRRLAAMQDGCSLGCEFAGLHAMFCNVPLADVSS